MVQISSLTSSLKANTPMPVRRVSRQVKQWLRDQRNKYVPARDVFTEIYEKGLWGSDDTLTFYSGPGSDSDAATPYCDFVRTFIAQHGINTVVDLGCGDFRVGNIIAPACELYTGVDIVRGVIAANSQRHGGRNVVFKCLDITTDALPDGDLCLIREVLQHLSNAQIQAILKQVQRYRYVLITDIQPADTSRFRINRDKAHGATSRLVHGSVLKLNQPPFNVAGISEIFETMLPFSAEWAPYGGRFSLRTFLIHH